MSDVRIHCRENGPYLIEGSVTILDHQGRAFTVPADKPKIALCRCGQSANRPFCDGSHKRVGFLAQECVSSPENVTAPNASSGQP
jgi:CDGSH-type Zn-finger protein